MANLSTVLLMVVLGFALTACTTVEPWQRGYLARPEMQFDPDPQWAKFRQHLYSSREGASGGYGMGGGGCGCN